MRGCLSGYEFVNARSNLNSGKSNTNAPHTLSLSVIPVEQMAQGARCNRFVRHSRQRCAQWARFNVWKSSSDGWQQAKTGWNKWMQIKYWIRSIEHFRLLYQMPTWYVEFILDPNKSINAGLLDGQRMNNVLSIRFMKRKLEMVRWHHNCRLKNLKKTRCTPRGSVSIPCSLKRTMIQQRLIE